MKFFAILFLTIALCLAVNADRVLNKRGDHYHPQVDCAKTVEEIDYRLNKYYKKLEDLTHDKNAHDFDHHHKDANQHLINQAAEITGYIRAYQTRCQANFSKIPGSGRFLQAVRGHCNEIKTYYSLMNQRIPNLNYYNSDFNRATIIVTSECSKV